LAWRPCSPCRSGETLTNPTNVQWIMAPALPLIAAAAPPAGRFARANQVAFVALSGLSGPFSILMIPIWLWAVCCPGNGATGSRSCSPRRRSWPGPRRRSFRRDAGNPRRATRPAARILERAARAVTEPFDANNGIRTFLIVSIALLRGCGQRRVCPSPSCLHGICRLARVGGGMEVRTAPGWLGSPIAGNRYFQIPAVMIAFCAITLLFEQGIARLVGIVGCVVLAQHAGKRFVRVPNTDYQQGVGGEQPRDWQAAAGTARSPGLDTPDPAALAP
jgi:hypothetical protein